MKNKRCLSTLLCLALLASLLAVPNGNAVAENGTSDNGLILTKKVTANDNDTYTIKLEAYATGEKTTTTVTEEIPTDIILVIDQSGSMTQGFENLTDAYVPYGTLSNAQNYSNRNNLWHKLSDGGYAKVTVIQKDIEMENYVPFNENATNEDYWNEADSKDGKKIVYIKGDDGEFKEVEIKREKQWMFVYYYYYYYYFEDGTVESSDNSGKPDLSGRKLYYKSNTAKKYTYTYKDADGSEQTISESIGEQTVYGTEFYKYEQAGSTITRLEALKRAATGFVNAVAKKAAGKDENVNTTDDNVNHRIAVVSYASIASNLTDEFKNMDAAGAADTVNRAINGLNANGGTMINDGISTANGIFASNPLAAGEKRNRVMIVFTDGAPGMYGDWKTSSTNTANSAISNAYTAKNTYGATVYTIGIFEGANASNPSSLPANNGNTNKTNRFMHLVSSNYKDAQSMTNTGSVNQNLNGGSYYLSAGDSSALNNIFEQISDQIETGSTSVTLDEKSVVKDIVTPYFDIPNGATGVTLKTADYTAENTFTKEVAAPETVKAEIKDNTLSVSGFSFKDNWCGEENGNYHGKKLIIEFTVKPKAGFLGGNGVPTNESAGIYENAAAEKPVVSAEGNPVDVQIKEVVITPLDTNVYLGAQYGAIVSGSEIKNNMRLTIGGVEVDLTKPAPNYGLADWQKKYVNIEVKITDINEQEVQYFEMLDDQQYKVTVTVKPTETGTATEETGEDNGTIHVFTPELTFKDGNVDYQSSIGNTAYTSNGSDKSYAAYNYVSSETKWTHIDETTGQKMVAGSEGVTMLGDQPELFLSYEPTSGVTNGKVTATDYVRVKVTVKLNDANGPVVTNKTTFVHQCDVNVAGGCQWNDTTMKDGNPAFLLHVINVVGDLTITKTGLNEKTYTGTVDQESAIFTVTSTTDSTKTWTVVVNCAGDAQTGSVTLTNLPAGEYTVTEISGWTWRYTVEGDASKTATVVGGKLDNSVVFNNNQTNDKWLGGDNYANNVFGSGN